MSKIKEVEKEAKGSNGLTQNEKIQVIITEVLDPVIAGAFYYYCWKNQFPKKARQANLYSFIIVGIELIIVILLMQNGLIKL